MTFDPTTPVSPVKVHHTELLPGDTREQYRQKIARITLDSMVQFVGLLDPQGTVLEINRVALDAVGIQLSDVEGRPFWTTFWWQVSEEIRETLRDSIRRAAQGEFVRWDTEIFGRSGGKETIVIDASLCPVPDEDGNIVFITAEGRDITEKKAHEREIARQREELAKLDVLKTQFFANISHEFRTPLTLILGPLEEAMANGHGVLPEGIFAHLDTSHRNGLRLLKLVNTMLDFSRIEAGRVQASYQATDLAAFTAELASNFRSLYENAGLRLIVDCEMPAAAEPAYVDRDMWEKIVLNLLSNAFKFTLQGEVELRLAGHQSCAVLTVRDTGVGIPPEELPRMFERFHRVERSRGRTHEGTGIGLALVQELVKLHGGTIEVTSVHAQGSTFTVRIPLGKTHLDPQRVDQPAALVSTAVVPEAFVEEARRWLPEETERTPELAGPKPRIVWADDNADMRADVCRILSRRFDVEPVTDGEAALEAAQKQVPDLVLADIMMPKLDGFGLLRELRADPRLREVPIILLSARAGEESRIEGIEAGADDYLVKPFSARELMARIDTHIKVAHIRQEAKALILAAEARFRAFANAAPAILWIGEPDGSFSFISRGWSDFTGQEERAALGFGWLQCMHPDDRESAMWVIQEAARKQEAFSMDIRLRRGDGQYRWTMNSGRPRFEPDGSFAGFTGSVIDIHERKEAAQNSALLSAIVDSSDDAIIGKDLNGIILSWNKSAERLFGYTAAEAVGQSILMLIPPERVNEEPRILEQLKRGERVDHFETIRVRKDGTRLHISLTISPVRDSEGRIVGASKIARDITDWVRQNEALQNANKALNQANQDLQQFAYSASHDLQEPLRIVAVFSELLHKRFGDQLGPTGNDYIAQTIHGARRMESLLRDLRTYTEVSTAEKQVDGEIDAEEIFDRTLENLAMAIQESGASVQRTALPRVRLNPVRLEQVFQNLIGNAVRYRNEAPPCVRVSAARDGDVWKFSVRDNGIGIEPQYREQIFGIFKRLHTKSEYPGTGMGLAICQRIIERAGGRIWVESQSGHGSTFHFTLPA
jgi:PAS domain S-box-containing protein